jgi:hypothetical protein
MALLDDIASLISGAGLGTEAIDIFKGRLPENPDHLIALTDYAGRTGRWTHDGDVSRYPRVQVITRDKDPKLVRQWASDIRDLLDGMTNLDVGSSHYLRIDALSDPFPLSYDASARTVIACNYEIWT